jgi:SRSO17 transposase
MVLGLKGPDPAAVRAGQQFLGEGAWSDEALISRHQRLVGDSLGEGDGVVIVDGSGFPKQGRHSVGVAPQYCGALGNVANCQEGVFAAYASSKGYTFLTPLTAVLRKNCGCGLCSAKIRLSLEHPP